MTEEYYVDYFLSAVETETRHEIISWLWRNLNIWQMDGDWRFERSTKGMIVENEPIIGLWFNNENDAMAFKLRWL